MPSYRLVSRNGSEISTFDAADDADAEVRGRALGRAHRSGRPPADDAQLDVTVERRSPDGWQQVVAWSMPRSSRRGHGTGDARP